MIKIETGNGIIMAEAVIEGIPVNPVDLPSMEFINPHRRGEVQAERIWIRRPWCEPACKIDPCIGVIGVQK